MLYQSQQMSPAQAEKCTIGFLGTSRNFAKSIEDIKCRFVREGRPNVGSAVCELNMCKCALNGVCTLSLSHPEKFGKKPNFGSCLLSSGFPYSKCETQHQILGTLKWLRTCGIGAGGKAASRVFSTWGSDSQPKVI